MKKALLALAAAGAAVSAQADVKLSGFVTAQALEQKDAENVVFTRNGFSQSRFRIDSSSKMGDLTVGTNMEFGLPNDESSCVDTANCTTHTDRGLNVRRNSFYIKGEFGTVRLGYHNDVGDGILNVGSSGTWTSNALTDISYVTGINSAVNGFDPGRSHGLRYYSPKIADIATIGAQFQNEGGFELALRVNTNGFKFGYYTENGGDVAGVDNDDKEGFVFGYKTPFGLSLTYTKSEREDGSTKATDEYDAFKVGYQTGKHKISLSTHARDNANQTVDIETTAFGYEFSAAKGVLFYVAYAETDGLVQNAIETEEDRNVAIGGLVKF